MAEETLTDEQRAAQIAALIEERRGYEIHGQKDRVAEVDAVLSHLGHQAQAPAKRAQTRKAAGKK